MADLRRGAESFDAAAGDNTLASEDFLGLDQVIARAVQELPPLSTSRPDNPQGADIVAKLRALVEVHGAREEFYFSDPQTKVDVQELLPGLDEARVREFMRAFVRELEPQQVAVPDHMVGAILGQDDTTVIGITNQAGVRIPDTQNRLVRIAGSPEAVDNAQTMANNACSQAARSEFRQIPQPSMQQQQQQHVPPAENTNHSCMVDLRQEAESFEVAAKDKTLSSEDFRRLDQAVARAEKQLTPLTPSEPDDPRGADIVVKLRALVEVHGAREEFYFLDPQTKADLQALLPGLDEGGTREFVREFVQELKSHEVMTGENFSGNPEELAGDVDDVYDGHIEALEGTRDLIGTTFNKVSERVTDEGPEVDDGLVEEVAEALVEGVQAVNEHLANCEVAGKVGEAIADVCGAAHDTLREGVGMGAKGIHAAGRGLNGAGEEVASQEMEQMNEAATNSIGEIALDSLAEEAAETAADMFPVVGAVMPTYNLVGGSLKTVVGAGGLVVGGATAALGGLVGAFAAPFDGGATWGGAMNFSRRTSAWSASVAGEGTLIAAKGVAGLCNQVPGSQVVTIPAKIGLGWAANSVKELRTSSRRDVDIGVDDCEGAITENMVQVGKTYQLESTDGKRLLGASKTKSSRAHGFQMMGYRHGGYSLTFGDAQSAEAEEEGASSFSFSGSPETYRLHSGMHNNNTLFFMGATYPAEWVVSDVEGKTTGAWEVLQLKWQEGGEKFKILGHGGQYVKWFEPEGIFKGIRTEWEATEFVLKEKNSG